jgi:hypothetical protein
MRRIVSLRRHVSLALGLLALAALVVGVFAGPAMARPHYSHAQKAKIRAQLGKAIKKNPKLIGKASFLKKAGLVDFSLPVTVRVRQATDQAGGFTNNGLDNTATLDLGPSLGSRTIGLGGSLPAAIKFKDSFDGGGLGNVDLTLQQGGSGLTTTSIPLLTNHNTTTVAPGAAGGGCAGYPYIPNDVDNWANFNALAPAANDPGVNNLGNGPFSAEPGAVAGDTVLRTNTLSLKIDAPNTTVTAATLGLPAGTVPSFTVGNSGGQANLFGNLPGKSTQIDVTANLATQINSILREVDGDLPGLPGNHASLFNCRQAWTGTVENHLGGIHLNGTLSISPAITGDGKLRIAKASLQSPALDPARVAVAACLSPQQAYATETNAPPPNPALNPTSASLAPTAPCDTVQSPTLQSLGFTGLGVGPGNGDEVAVQGALTVNTLKADILIGQ